MGPQNHWLVHFSVTSPPPLALETMGKALNGNRSERDSGRPIMSVMSPANSIYLPHPYSRTACWIRGLLARERRPLWGSGQLAAAGEA